MNQQPIAIGPHFLSLSDVSLMMGGNATIAISDEAVSAIKNCRKFLDEKLKNSNAPFYGINTGFGFLQHVKIDAESLEQLQANLIRSHACGMGEEVPQDIVRLMLLLKIKSLSYGNSGVQLQTVERLAEMVNHQIYPVIYTQGSLGASGDLAPLSHLSLPLIGEGTVFKDGEKISTERMMQSLGWVPIHLQSKEGLALINGTQFMSAYGIHIILKVQKLFDWSNRIAALSYDAFDCTTEPLTAQIHQIRPHKGQVEVAHTLSNLLSGSQIAAQKNKQVQDPYSFRCIPQVHGASFDALEYVTEVFLKEINSVTDNPNIFPDEDMIVSGGNFHGQPLALALDFLSMAIAEMGSISERRTYQLISGQRSLPPFLVKNPGLHSGFMIPQYTAAGIVSENKQLCTPACVDTIPSSNNQEDHVSMGANAATKCKRVADNLQKILAIELLTAAQALEFRRPLLSSAANEQLIAGFRQLVSFNEHDRILHEDMMKAAEFLVSR